MNNRITKNFSYAFISNAINMIVSILPTLVLPRIFGSDIESYGFYQVYVFYISYVGLAHLGAIDGIYLKEGGKDYSKLDFSMYSSQFWILLLLESAIGIAIGLYGTIFFQKEYIFITWMISANIILLCLRTYFLYIFQATNCIKQYSVVTIIGRVFYAITFILLILLKNKNYESFIFFDVVAKIISLCVAIKYGKELVIVPPAAIKISLKEFYDNIRIGCQLMLASISGMLVTGIVRWGIQQQWDITTYGKISLSLSACNIVSVLINAVAMVLYPELKRKSVSDLNRIYTKLQNFIMIPLMSVLILYYPFKTILTLWVPNYADSLNYLAILFPVSILSVKMTVMIQTYMKVLRMESAILITNLLGLIFAVLSMTISVFLLKNLDLAIASIVINTMFRNIISEIVLKAKMGIKNYLDLILESCLVILFILSSWIIGGVYGVVIYFCAYVIYLSFKHQAVKQLIYTAMKKINN